jgi:CheY-like chemotaxis protein
MCLEPKSRDRVSAEGGERGFVESSVSLLIVEDEPLSGMLMANALEAKGYSVSLCGTGYDALNYIEMEDGIAAVVTDIRLGDGPDGWEVARHARAHFPEARIVYITGFADEVGSDEAVPESVLLEKPVEVEELISTVSRLLN